MNAFFVWLEFSDTPIDRRTAEKMFARIETYGGDVKDLQLSDRLAIGVQSRWVTPEEVGECQPLFDKADTECFLFDGRIDNREHLISELSAEPALSDGSLLQAFLQRFGESRLAEVIGPFAFVQLNLASGAVMMARDTMGGRYLVYYQTAERLIIANTELAFIDHPELGHRLNQRKISSWLINRQEDHHSTCLHGLKVLNPGRKRRWRQANGAANESTFYRPKPERRLRFDNDAQYAAEFRRLLDQAVHRRLRSRTKIGTMLSGGMDSVPMTISAASQIDPDQLQAYSWVFDKSPKMDERLYSAPVCEALGIEQKLVVCDDLWPQFDDDTHNNPLFPFALPYSEFQQQTFRQAKAEGVSVMLSGIHGDLLYESNNRQVISALKQGNLVAALREFNYLKSTQDLNFLQAVKRYLIAPVHCLQPWIKRRQLSKPVDSDVLINEMTRNLKQQTHWLFQSSLKARRPVQYRIVMDGMAGEDIMLGRIMENKYQIERRYPFRDRDLCEFMLAIPTEQLTRLGVKRPIVKHAYQAEFTQALADRNDKTTFLSALLTGIEKDKKWRALLNLTPSYWQQYVKECYKCDENATQSPHLLVMWQCAYYNFWYRMWYDHSRGGVREPRGQTPKIKSE